MSDAGDPPVTLALVHLVLLDLAAEIEAEQHRYVAWGLRRAPDWAQMERVRVLRRAADLVERLRADPRTMAALGFRRRADAEAPP